MTLATFSLSSAMRRSAKKKTDACLRTANEIKELRTEMRRFLTEP